MESQVNQNGYAKTASVQQLQNRLNEEKTVQAINHLIDRIGTLEQAVEKLTVLMDQGPGMMAMTVDMIDETYRKADAQGISIENRLKGALQVAEKLTHPEMIKKVDQIVEFTNQAPGLIAMAGDVVDETFRQANARGVNIENRMATALQLAERLTEPRMVDKLNGLMDFADKAEGLIAMAGDVFDEEMKRIQAMNIDVQAIADIAEKATSAMTEAKQMPDAKVGGIFSMLRTMRDPDRQKAIGFIMKVAKAFGRKL